MKLQDDKIIWNIGDTSFRRKNIIEETYELLNELYKFNQRDNFEWDRDTQLDYYIAVKDIITKETPKKRKSKKEDSNYIDGIMRRSRTYTSGLVKLGFCTEKRFITEVGLQFLEIYQGNLELDKDNFEDLLAVNDINIVYLRQMLKLDLVKGNSQIYPIRLLMEILMEFKYLDQDELNLFLFVVDKESYDIFRNSLGDYRSKKISYSTMKSRVLNIDFNILENTDYLSKIKIDENEIPILFPNRKSQKSSDKKIIELLKAIEDFVVNPNGKSFEELKNTIQKKQYDTLKLKGVLKLNKTNKYDQWSKEDFPMLSSDLRERRTELYKYISAQSNMNTAKDYIDIFKRNINLTGLFDFKSSLKLSSETIKKFTNLVIIPEKYSYIYPESYDKVTNTNEIFNCNITDRILTEYEITTEELRIGTMQEHSSKLEMIAKQNYTREKLITILKLFIKDDNKSRNKILELTTDNAKIPTIYEYIIGMCWYYISDYKFDLYNSLNLIMDGSMSPLTHAPGGKGDIEITYPESNEYAMHTLLIELTLMDKSNQRRNELEPVIRHGYNIKALNQSIENYSLFVSNEIDENVMTIHSICNKLPFKIKDTTVQGVDIFAMDTAEVLYLLEENIKYKTIYNEFKVISEKNEFNVNKILDFRNNIMKKTN